MQSLIRRERLCPSCTLPVDQMELEDEDAMEVVDSPCSDTFSSGAKVQLLEPYTSLLRSSMLESDVSVSCRRFARGIRFPYIHPRRRSGT